MVLTGIIRCARCKSHMFGGGGHKNGVRIPYYVCSKRFNDHDCEQDYVRAELLESAIVEDVKGMFRDEQFIARVWEEANKQLGAEKPNIEKEIEKVEAQATKTQAAIDRYFAAFEAGTLEPGLCNEKVRDLHARLNELEGEKQDLEARRERLELPAIDREMLSTLVDNFERVMAEAPGPQRKDLLRRMVKKVLVHDRRTIEIWYRLPNPQRFEYCNIWLPECNSIRTGRVAQPEVWFRILHVGGDGRDGATEAPYREQTVEIALGPKGVFGNGKIGAMTRRVAAERVVSAVPASRSSPKPSSEPRTPRVVELLRKALEWQALLESGEVASQASIARREGITRARVTQVMGLLRLAPEIQHYILSMATTVPRPVITERALRPITQLEAPHDQTASFRELLNLAS